MARKLKTYKVNIRLDENGYRLLTIGTIDKGYLLGDKTNKKPNRAKYIRALIEADNTSLPSIDDLRNLHKDLGNLYKIGMNLNQAVYHLNDHLLWKKMNEQKPPSKVSDRDLLELQKTVLEIQKELPILKKSLAEILKKVGKD